MSLYKRGGVYWFEFMFQGQRIRESAGTNSKTLAEKIERHRRRQLEESANGILKRERPPLLSVADERWIDSRAGLAPHTLENYRLYSASSPNISASALFPISTSATSPVSF